MTFDAPWRNEHDWVHIISLRSPWKKLYAKSVFVRKRSLFVAHGSSAIDLNQMWMSIFLYHVKSYLSLFGIYSSWNSSWDMPDFFANSFFLGNLDLFQPLLTYYTWPKIDRISFWRSRLSIGIYCFLSLVATMCAAWDQRGEGGCYPPRFLSWPATPW